MYTGVKLVTVTFVITAIFLFMTCCITVLAVNLNPDDRADKIILFSSFSFFGVIYFRGPTGFLSISSEFRF